MIDEDHYCDPSEAYEDWKTTEMKRLREGRDAWRLLALMLLLLFVGLFCFAWGAGS